MCVFMCFLYCVFVVLYRRMRVVLTKRVALYQAYGSFTTGFEQVVLAVVLRVLTDPLMGCAVLA